MCWAPRSVGWSPPSSPTRPGCAALGVSRLIRFAAARDIQLRRPVAERLVDRGPQTRCRPATPWWPGGCWPPTWGCWPTWTPKSSAPKRELAALLPLSPFATLTSVPGWGVVRVSNYAAALGDPDRWPGPRQIYRASGLSPMQYESAGKRRDGTISREGSVALRRALIDLGIGLWLTEPAAKAYAAELKARGKHGGIIALRAGPPRHPHRLRPGPRPRRLRPVPLGLTSAVGFPRSRPPAPETQELSTCSARSAARTNDVDSDEHRRTLTGRGNPPTLDRTEGDTTSNAPLHNCGRQCQAERTTKGRIRCRDALWRTQRVTPMPSLAPGPSPSQQPERRQMTHQP